ncbi:LuxR C-terminal-related transcriptional regulator [Nocardia sp. NBC_01503]|uniref:LuxR C-terminal-related transcriptional regulator n=1 Tax=Nocardia sp. NBC_01503 TaxID=2975997 RepID=UPI002E7BCD90|nr:LuxR C-terminal-related transcriptional regulator [Nocardia sp. NBC_01503]WTL34985.1 LuxR C-terminal-related transcriptional regulator [Nocardia sp. NBC_01503]
MIGNPPVALDTLPCAREIFRELDSDDPAPLLYLLRGRSGTGKSTLLTAIRNRLRAHGVTLTENPAEVLAQRGGPHPRGRGALALVLDDAQAMTDADFETLCAAVESGTHSVVVATLPRPHDARLRALAEAVARRGRVVDLRALGVTEIAPFARELGMMVPRGLAQHIHRQTAGIHGGVVAALTAACATRLDSGIPAVDAAVTAWARARLDDADPEMLDTFVVAAIGAGLDTSELAEVLDINHTAAQDLVDRARASALITDADLLLAPAIAPLRTLVGDRRLLSVQRRLLHARLDAGLLRDHTALLLAESGVRDPRLAEFLCTTAEKAGDEAARHYAAAAAAGADRDTIALRWADAAARTGDCDTALRLAEPLLARPTPRVDPRSIGRTSPADAGSAAYSCPTDLAAAVRICAGVWTRRGLAARAAQLYTWLGPDRVGADWAVAATVQYLAGDAHTGHTLSASAAHWPPTEATARAALIAGALADSVESPKPPILFARADQYTDRSGPIALAHDDTSGAAAFALPAQRPNGSVTAEFAARRGVAAEPAPDGTRRTDDAPASGYQRGFVPHGSPPVASGMAMDTAGFTAVSAGATARRSPAPRPEPTRAAAMAAASALIHAAHSGVGPGENGGDRFLPCSAVSIAVLLCLSMGEPRRAADALRGTGQDPQHLALAAWVAMLGGDEQSAAAVIEGLDLAKLDARDRLLAHGIIVGLARRSGDHTALTLAWRAAYPLFDEVGADLLALLPIGELWLAGIRLRDEGRIEALVAAAGELLRGLGDPPAWANAFHWYAIQAAIARECPNELLPHAHRLKAAAAAGDPQAAALADAGRTWVLVLRGQVQHDQVQAAVARLAGLGLRWDAARLASEAALAADDSAVATALLKLARTVRAQSHPPEPMRAPAPAAPAPRSEPRTDTVLSEREREVAELVLLGLTYREIGARLYISAKTVEHHVARIRRRIGASSRSELLSMLRAMGHGSLLV